MVKTIGSATTLQQVEGLKQTAREEMKRIQGQSSLFISEQDEQIKQAFALLSNSSIRTVGAELVFGKIYDYVGFGKIGEELSAIWSYRAWRFRLAS